MAISSYLACSTCRVTMIEGGGNAASWSIFFLLIVILMLLAVVITCFVRIARREREHLDPTLSDDYQPTDS